MSRKKKSDNVFKKLKPYYKHLSPVKWHFIGGILASLLYSLASGLGLPLMSRTAFPIIFKDKDAMNNVPEWFLNIAQSAFKDNLEEGLLICSILGLPLVMLLRSTGQFISGYLMSYTGLRVSEGIRTSVFHNIQSMPLAFFQKYKSGDLLSRLMGDTESVKKGVVNVSNNLFKQPMTLISAVGCVIYLAIQEESFLFAMFAALSAPLLVLPIRAIGNKLAKRSKQLATTGAELTSFTTESLQSPLEIRAYNLQEPVQEKFRSQIRYILKLSIKHVKYGLLTAPLIEVVAACSLSFALYAGVSKGMTMGGFMALATALYMAYEPVKKLSKIHGTLRSMEAPLDRLAAITNETNTVPESSSPVSLPSVVKGDITFQQVSFSYNKRLTALQGVNCHIKAGDRVALVGASGAGKSTFINLIPRFYDATEGAILIDGVNVKDLRKKDLRSLISYVPQMPILFNQSILENIRVGKQEATKEEVIKAAQLAFADDFIMETPDGYDTILSERGNSLSGGQRQRIAIARAFLKNAPILILDEATSALDNESEKKITQALRELVKGKTTLMIAHRESSLSSSTRRITFAGGKILSDDPVSI